MKVYICYDRYEYDEWLRVYSIGTDRDEMIKKCKEEDLPSFIEYGPDDCHSFQLVEIEITKSQYNQLVEWIDKFGGGCEGTEEDEDFYNFMCRVYDDEFTVETIISTDGCSDYPEIVRYYSVMYKNCDIDEVSDSDWVYGDEFYEYDEELTDDDDLYNRVVKEYVQETY